MKRFILLALVILAVGQLIIQPAHSACSTDPNSPGVLPGFTITSGTAIMWRLRAVDPDYGVWGGYVDIVAGSNPAWVTFGPRVAPDVNQYAFAPKNLNCVGDVTDPNVTFVASRRIKIAPPANVYGNFDIKFSTTDSNQTSYWRIPFVVSRPQNMGVTSNAGPD